MIPEAPRLYNKLQRKVDAPLQPKEIMSGASRNFSEMMGQVASYSPEMQPLKEFDTEMKIEQAQKTADQLRGRLAAKRQSYALGQAQAQGAAAANRAANRTQAAYENWSASQGYKAPPIFRSIDNPSPQLQALTAAIFGQESGGDYGVVNKTSGAMGKYQVMPSNIAGPGGWDQEILGRNITTGQYLHHKRLQDAIAIGKIDQYLKQFKDPRSVAAAWYAGPANATSWQRSTGSQGEYPSVYNYVQQVYGRYTTKLQKIQAHQKMLGVKTGFRGLGDPTKGAGNWVFGSEGDWGHRNIGQGFHTGVDFDVPIGTPIYASQSGRISTANWDDGYGNQMFINGSHRTQTRYQHLSRFARGLKAGTYVKKGQLIGYSGDTGSYSQGAHLHFETLRHLRNTGRFDPRRIEQGWTSVDPFRFFRRYNPHVG